MASYSLRWKNSAERDLASIGRPHAARLLRAGERLAENPFPPGCRKLHGAESLYRIRVGDYRILYEVDAERREITVVHARHRKDAYRNL